MTPQFSYRSDLFESMPDHSGYLAIYISESRCDIAICSSSFVLVYLEQYVNKSQDSQANFLKDLFASKQSLFAKHYQEVNIGILHHCFTLLPHADTNEDEVLRLLCGESDEPIFTDKISFLDGKLVYRISQEIIKIINQSFEKQHPIHCFSIALELARKASTYDQLLIIDEGFFDIISKKGEHIYSVNRHEFEAPEDITYYTLLNVKDAKVDAQDAKVIITGACDKSSEIYNNLSEFIGKVDIKKLNEMVTIRSDYDQPHQYAEYVLNLLHANY